MPTTKQLLRAIREEASKPRKKVTKTGVAPWIQGSGGRGSKPSPNARAEAERQRAMRETQARIDAIAKRQAQAKLFSERRRLDIQKQRELARLRSIRQRVSVDVARRGIQSESARIILQEARRRGIAINTPVQQRRFINQLQKEQREQKPVKAEKEIKETTIKRQPEDTLSTKLVPGIPIPLGISVPGTFVGDKIQFREITKVFAEILGKKGITRGRVANLLTMSDARIDNLNLNSEQKQKIKAVNKFVKGSIKGISQEIVEDPEKIIATTAFSVLTPATLSRLGATPAVMKVLNKIPENIRKKGASAITRSLTAGYLASVGLRVVKEPTAEARGKSLGRIAIGEIAPFQVGTKFGVRGLLKEELQKEINIALKGMSKKRQGAFKDYMKQTQVFKKFEPKPSNIKLNNIESIPKPKAQKVIRNFLKGSKGNVVVGGSVAQTSQVKVTRKLGDMDLYIESGNTHKIAKKLANRLKEAGVKRVSNVRGQVTIEGKKAIEFHNIDRLITNIEGVTPIWASPRSYIVTTPEGIKIQRISVQAKRKLVAGFADPKRLATGKYKKDIQDFKKIADRIFKEAVKKSKNAYFFKKKKLKAVEKIFKRRIPKIPKTKKVKISKIVKLKKPKIIKRKGVTPTRKKVRVAGVGIKKISKKELRKIRLSNLKKARAKLKRIKKTKKITPSQKPVKKKIKIKPSQLPVKKRKPTRPSQPPTRPPKKLRLPPPLPPKRPTPPSQPPTRPPKKPPRPPPPPPLKRPTLTKTLKKRRKAMMIVAGKGSIKRKKQKKPVQVFDVFGKSRGKFVKLNVKPLTKRDALSKGAFAVDYSTARTLKILPKGKSKTPGDLLKKERGYFPKHKRKFRAVRIKRGKKFVLKNKYIEKTKFSIDRRTEKRGLTLQRLLKQRKVQKVVKRKITSTQRKVLLKNLAKARRVKKLKRGRK